VPGIEARTVPHSSHETADALVFYVESKAVAKRCRDELVKVGLSTKILPEAYAWHFAGTWNHMPTLAARHGGDLMGAFRRSHDILSRAVSLPVGVKLADEEPSRVRTALQKALYA
jgi:8-amino-3,8-dideoxy-alpha-D-manno-octulosonate transaminase